LDSGKEYDVVFEATLATPMARAPLIAIAEIFECPLNAVFWEIDINICLYENSIREHKLPTNYLYELNNTMTVPDMIEGFSRVTVMNVQEIGVTP
jgi:predicted kinase